MQKYFIYIVAAFIVGGVGGYLIPRPAPVSPVIPDSNAHTSMHTAMDSMTASLHNKTGETFDRAFLDEMIVHHEGAVEMAKLVLISTDRPELKQLANEIISAQTKEIHQMKEWKLLWFEN